MRIRHFLLFSTITLAGCFSPAKKTTPETPAQHGLTWKLLHPFAHSDTSPSATLPPPPKPVPSPSLDFTPPPKHDLTWRIFHPFAKNETASVKTGVEMAIVPDTATPSLADARQISLKIQVINLTANLVALNFPTSQRLEITTRSTEGKIIYTWSQDQLFTPTASTLFINPGERLEYSEAIPTREMSAGKNYTVTVSLVGQDGLTGSVTITPKP